MSNSEFNDWQALYDIEAEERQEAQDLYISKVEAARTAEVNGE